MTQPIQSISIIIPVYNEEGNVRRLKEEICAVLPQLGPMRTEVILVDDGSRDQSRAMLRAIAQEDPRFKVVLFKRNYGQTAAMACAIRMATGEVIVPMDADLQNDPADIPMLLEKMREGYSCVSGWRKNRKDAFLNRTLPSWVANALIAHLTKVHIHDYGCTLKAYRKEVLDDLELYGEMHRFIPAYAVWVGAKITEIPVNHRPRMAGESKYGLSRTLKVILDLLVFKYLTTYGSRPIHFFGSVGFVSLALGGTAEIAAIILRLYGLHLVQTPLPTVGAMFIIVGVQFILFGLIAEMLMRTYYESGSRRPYAIKETINLHD